MFLPSTVLLVLHNSSTNAFVFICVGLCLCRTTCKQHISLLATLSYSWPTTSHMCHISSHCATCEIRVGGFDWFQRLNSLISSSLCHFLLSLFSSNVLAGFQRCEFVCIPCMLFYRVSHLCHDLLSCIRQFLYGSGSQAVAGVRCTCPWLFVHPG